jgi:hypothetical protein
VLPDVPETLLPLGPLALALPEPVALVAVPPLLSCVPAEEPPVPSVDALTPLPAVALPPLPVVLELLALPDGPDAPEVVAPFVLVVVLLSALRTPVPPSAWRPAAKPRLSVVLVPLVPVPVLWACVFIAVATAAIPASRLRLSVRFIVDLPFAVLRACCPDAFVVALRGCLSRHRRNRRPT